MTALHLMSVSLAVAGLVLVPAAAMAVTPYPTADSMHPVRDAEPPIVLQTSLDGTTQTSGAVAWTQSIGACHRAIH